MKLTTERLKELIKEEMAQQNMDAEMPNVDNDLMTRLKMFANHTHMSGAEKISEILKELKKAGFLSKDPRESQS
jgi:hypothetical protein